MAKSFTPQAIHTLMNQLVKEATGQSAISVVDTNTFVSAGETVLATGVENTLNSLAIVLGRSLMAVRPYKAKLAIINSLNSDLYTSRIRKISFYARENEESGDWNTNLHTNLKSGYDNGSNSSNSVASMWQQNQPKVLEMNFGGQDVWEASTTVYENQLKVAFRSEDEFAQFIAGIMTEKANDIEQTKEAYNRMALLNYMAGVIDLNQTGSVINLTSAFNTRYGTTYTSEELRNEHATEFLEFFVAQFKIVSDYMTERSAKYHWTVDKTEDGETYKILRHTPRDRQRCILYSPFFTEAKTKVFPEIFNEQYLDMDSQYEGVNYWQSINSPAAIDVTPAIPDTDTESSTYGTQIQGAEVSETYVLGMLYDQDAIMIDYQLEAANTTPLEARKRYRNIWWTFSRNVINDFTENAVVFIMKD